MVKSPPLAVADHTSPWSAAVVRAGSSAIRDLLELTEQPHVLSLAGGLPHPGSFPVDAIARATAEVLATDATAALQYGPTEGYGPLRSWAADRLGTTADRVLVTSGSQQALELIARALVEPGATVALAEPAYVGALQAFRSAGATLVPIASDQRGLDVDALAEALEQGLRPTLVYVVSNLDNPTGATLDARRRLALAHLADHHGLWIVDDDPYGELRWRGAAPPPLRALTDRVITLGSTSKVLCPGLRVGWASGPPDVLRAMAILKQSADLHTSSLTQRIAHRVLAEPGFLDHHVTGLRTTYEAKARALTAALADRLGEDLAWRSPDGGMFVWATLRDHVAPGRGTADLLPTALDHGVAFVPGAAFAVAGATPGSPIDRSLRLSFATGSPDELGEAVDRLATTLGHR